MPCLFHGVALSNIHRDSAPGPDGRREPGLVEQRELQVNGRAPPPEAAVRRHTPRTSPPTVTTLDRMLPTARTRRPPCWRCILLQSALVHVDTALMQRALAEPAWADRLAMSFMLRSTSADADTLNRELARLPAPPDRTRAVTRAEVDTVFRLDVALREKTYWRLLYESAARAD